MDTEYKGFFFKKKFYIWVSGFDLVGGDYGGALVEDLGEEVEVVLGFF